MTNCKNIVRAGTFFLDAVKLKVVYKYHLLNIKMSLKILTLLGMMGVGAVYDKMPDGCAGLAGTTRTCDPRKAVDELAYGNDI